MGDVIISTKFDVCCLLMGPIGMIGKFGLVGIAIFMVQQHQQYQCSSCASKYYVEIYQPNMVLNIFFWKGSDLTKILLIFGSHF